MLQNRKNSVPDWAAKNREHMIATDKCELNDLKTSDIDHIVRLETNPEVRQFLGGSKDVQTIHSEFHQYFKTGIFSQRWTIRSKEDDPFIGTITLDTHHNGIDTEVSYQILPEWWGLGYATETLRTVMEYCLEELKLPRIIAETQVANLKSCRLLEQLGFCLESRIERFGEEQAIYAIDGISKTTKRKGLLR